MIMGLALYMISVDAGFQHMIMGVALYMSRFLSQRCLRRIRERTYDYGLSPLYEYQWHYPTLRPVIISL